MNRQKENSGTIYARLWNYQKLCFTQMHRLTLNLQGLKIMIVESFPSSITNLGCVVFEKWVKQVTKSFWSQETKTIWACKIPLTSYDIIPKP